MYIVLSAPFPRFLLQLQSRARQKTTVWHAQALRDVMSQLIVQIGTVLFYSDVFLKFFISHLISSHSLTIPIAGTCSTVFNRPDRPGRQAGGQQGKQKERERERWEGIVTCGDEILTSINKFCEYLFFLCVRHRLFDRNKNKTQLSQLSSTVRTLLKHAFSERPSCVSMIRVRLVAEKRRRKRRRRFSFFLLKGFSSFKWSASQLCAEWSESQVWAQWNAVLKKINGNLHLYLSDTELCGISTLVVKAMYMRSGQGTVASRVRMGLEYLFDCFIVWSFDWLIPIPRYSNETSLFCWHTRVGR